MAVQGGGVVLRVEAVVGRDPLQAAEGRLAAPGLGQPLTALEALNALEGILATKLPWGGDRGVRALLRHFRLWIFLPPLV